MQRIQPDASQAWTSVRDATRWLIRGTAALSRATSNGRVRPVLPASARPPGAAGLPSRAPISSLPDGFAPLSPAGDMYGFANRPNIPPNAPPQAFPILTFQQGRFINNEGTFPIHQLVIYQNGDLVSAANTEVAEVILDDYIVNLNTNYGYRYEGKPQKRYYLSTVVVEFEADIVEQVKVLRKIREILTHEIRRDEASFNIKNLVFGTGDPVVGVISSPEIIERSDFTIERRGGEPYERNRFFSSAPVRTPDHVRILELIETSIRS